MSLAKSFKQNFDSEMKTYAQRIEQTMKNEVHVKTGALRDSITTEKKGSSYLVGVDASSLMSDSRNVSGYDYSAVYYYGHSRGFTIRSKSGKPLRWVDDTGVHYAYSVYHPPTTGDKFVDRTVANRPRFGE